MANAPKGTKKSAPYHTAELAQARPVPSLRRCCGGTPCRAIHGPARLARRPASPPPQQHLRSASCDGRLRCTDYRVAAEASALKAKSKKQKLAPAPNLDLERGRTPGGAAKCPGGVFQCAPTGITEVYRMPPRWFSPDAFRWHLLCIQHGASARPDPEPVIPSLASSSPLK